MLRELRLAALAALSVLALAGASGEACAQAQSLQTFPVAPGTPISCSSGDVSNAIASCTLAAAPFGHTTYIDWWACGVSGSTSGSVVDLTVTGVAGGTQTWPQSFPTGATNYSGFGYNYAPPLPASAQGTAIVVSLPAGGGGSAHASCSAGGFQL